MRNINMGWDGSQAVTASGAGSSFHLASLQGGPWWRVRKSAQFYPPNCSPKSWCTKGFTNDKQLASTGSVAPMDSMLQEGLPSTDLQRVSPLHTRPQVSPSLQTWVSHLQHQPEPESQGHQITPPWPTGSLLFQYKSQRLTNTLTIYEAFDTYLHIHTISTSLMQDASKATRLQVLMSVLFARYLPPNRYSANTC